MEIINMREAFYEAYNELGISYSDATLGDMFDTGWETSEAEGGGPFSRLGAGLAAMGDIPRENGNEPPIMVEMAFDNLMELVRINATIPLTFTSTLFEKISSTYIICLHFLIIIELDGNNALKFQL